MCILKHFPHFVASLNMIMRSRPLRRTEVLLLALLTSPSVGCAGATANPSRGSGSADASLTAADSALVGRILLAEDRRDSTDGALGAGARHGDARVRLLAQRA